MKTKTRKKTFLKHDVTFQKQWTSQITPLAEKAAQKRDPSTGRYSKEAYISSFCGMAPASNPKLTILVIIDEPEGDYWASTVAVPVFQDVAYRSLCYLRIPPDDKNIYLADGKK